MTIEKSVGNIGQLDKTKNRLHLLSLFSKNDFSTPADILKRSDELVELFRENVWKRRGFANNVFADYVKSKDPEKIKYSDLLSSIFSFYRYDDTKVGKRDTTKVNAWIRQSEINDVIESLNGNNLDYIENKKNFLLTRNILPAYFVVRSFKEKDSKWLHEILARFDKQEQQELVDRIINLKNNLLIGVDSPEAKTVILNQFNRSLGILNRSETPFIKREPVVIKTKGELKLTVPNRTIMKAKNDPFKDENLREKIETKTTQFIEFLLTHNYIYINWKGKLRVDNARFKKFGKEVHNKTEKDKRDIFHNLAKIFGENNAQDIGAFSTLISLSPRSSIPWNLNEISQDQIGNIHNLTRSFQKSIETVWTVKESREKLAELLSKKCFSLNSDFSDFNRQLTVILYQHYYQQENKPTLKQIEEFGLLPGVYHAFSSLRKLFLANLIQTEYKGINILTPSENVWPSVKKPEKLAQEILNPAELLEWEDQELINALAFLVVENFTQSNVKYFSNGSLKKTIMKNDIVIAHPDKFEPGKTIGINSNKTKNLKIPINTTYSDDEFILKFKNDILAQITILS